MAETVRAQKAQKREMRDGSSRCGVSVNLAFEAEQLCMETSGAGLLCRDNN